MIKDKGHRRIGVLGFSLKAGTDDPRQSPLVVVIERPLGKGYELRIFDRNVELARLTSANRDFILNHIPHISRLMVETIEDVLKFGETNLIRNVPLSSRMSSAASRRTRCWPTLSAFRMAAALQGDMMASAGRARRVLIIVENLPSPFDRRVWQEACTLHEHGYEVSIICPTGKGYESKHETIEGIHIYRYDVPIEAEGARGYAMEYSAALFHTARLAWKVHREHGFDVVHACNPPDLFFLIGGFFKLFFGKRFLFDHHDINPELYEAKSGHRDFFWRLMVWLEQLTFRTADVPSR